MRTHPAPAHAPSEPPGPLSDRWAFKPVAFLLLLATLFATAGVLAVLISPPFLAAGVSVPGLFLLTGSATLAVALLMWRGLPSFARD